MRIAFSNKLKPFSKKPAKINTQPIPEAIPEELGFIFRHCSAAARQLSWSFLKQFITARAYQACWQLGSIFRAFVMQ
ncbi:hypothetical protein D3C80_1957090 [compost metagenome]